MLSTSRKTYTLGLGLIQLGRPWGDPPKNETPSPAAAAEFIAEAVGLGIRFFDTAPAYGCGEERLGEALRTVDASVVVATKFGEHWDAANRTSFTDHSAEAILASVDNSFRLLGRVDLLQIHSCTEDTLRSPAVRALVSIVQRLGVAVGASVRTPEAFEAALGLDLFDALQFPLSLNDRRFVGVATAAAADQGPLMIVNRPFAMGPLGRGHQQRCAAFEFIGQVLPAAVVLTGTVDLVHLQENIAAFVEVFGEF